MFNFPAMMKAYQPVGHIWYNQSEYTTQKIYNQGNIVSSGKFSYWYEKTGTSYWTFDPANFNMQWTSLSFWFYPVSTDVWVTQCLLSAQQYASPPAEGVYLHVYVWGMHIAHSSYQWPVFINPTYTANLNAWNNVVIAMRMVWNDLST